MIKVIFLDIDGVLNHERFYIDRNPYAEVLPYPLSEIDPLAVQNLNTLIANTDAKVVISSTWRHSGIDACRNTLVKMGFVGDIIDITPDLRGDDYVRGNEILLWIKKNEKLVGPRHNFTEYVILDDDSDMLYWQRNNFILVDRYVGLTKGDVFQATKILNGGKIL